jgi:hypothetical protein
MTVKSFVTLSQEDMTTIYNLCSPLLNKDMAFSDLAFGLKKSVIL